MRKGKPERRGVTLIEAVLFISIALGLIVGGLVFYRQASTSAMMQRTLSLISALSVEMNMIHQTTEVPPGGFEASQVLAASGAIPSTALNDTGDGAKSPWGGRMTMFIITPAPAGYEQFGNQIHNYQFFDMPPEICTRFAHFDASGMGVLAFPMIAMIINSANLPDATPPDGRGFRVSDGPLLISDGAAACTAGSGPVWMYMAFAYR